VTVYAAGALCWRTENSKLLVAMIYRGRYGDWGWPKGKVDPGECLAQTAVREIAEETGLKIKLGIRVGIQSYNLPSGEPKEVHYWAAKVTTNALAKHKFVPNEEVEEVHWVEAKDAFAKLSYPHDAEPLQRLLDLHEAQMLETKPVIILRHAKAMARSDWKKGESSRPLLAYGAQQAKALVPLLNAFGIKQVVTSPWRRCQTTVKPYAASKGLKIIERSQFTEFGTAKGPIRAERTVHDFVDTGKATVICSHRPSLPKILDSLSEYADPALEIALNEGRALRPGQMMVAHLTVGSKDKKGDYVGRRVVAVETYTSVLE
jgi:8-oxo-dGTP pyrophosphatase MutT (NUDIX family)/phosphohistidine phosphatase SixA